MTLYFFSIIGVACLFFIQQMMKNKFKSRYKLKEFAIQSKYYGEDRIAIAVNSLPDVEYRWQVLLFGSIEWSNIQATYSNTYITSSVYDIAGNKYRCIIEKDGIVIGYSQVFTIPYEEREEEQENKKSEYTQKNDEHKSEYGNSTDDFDNMDGIQFENFCANLLRKNGYIDVKTTKASGDYGVDILAKKDDVTYAIQCKCYSNSVGNKAVQEVLAGKAYYKALVAIVITNNYFTSAAKEMAKETSVLLWDRDYLKELINKSGKDEKATNSEANNFFDGCETWEQVKKRYYDLQRIYHPDNSAGSNDIIKIINQQYEKLKEQYGK